jgi:NAD(P)-dependent dehydrogenase (short-subunit alcohol dehydrogenase family)
MDLSNRVALITGAGRRVGRAIALQLADGGMHIAVHCNASRAAAEETAADCRARGVRAEVFAADLADAAAGPNLVAEVTGRLGRLDVLINNASLFEPMALEQFDAGAWNRTMQVNLTAPMILAHAARAELRARCGRIVNLCDAASGRPWRSHLAYCVSKGALDTLTRALARAFAPEVNVVGVAPGVADWPDDFDAATRARLTAKIPLGRAGTPDDIAGTVRFLLERGDYITGAIVPVDGGRHLA